jgi:DNA-directed RNA polymerase sigma subunit (sigma70/sigma32)
MEKEKLKYNDGILNILHLLPGEVRERVSRSRVEEIFYGLTPKERTALKLRYGIEDGVERSYAEMGELMGMTTTGAMKLFKRTLKKVIDRASKSV